MTRTFDPSNIPEWTLLTVIGVKHVDAEVFGTLESAVKKYHQTCIDIRRRIDERDQSLVLPPDLRTKWMKMEYVITVILFSPTWERLFTYQEYDS